MGLLVFAAARQDLPQFHGKSMTGRAIGYPLAALVVPAGWWLLSRRRKVRFSVTYHDTLGDLALGLAGSILAGAAVAWIGRRPRPT